MADQEISVHFTKIAALGRNFKLGDFYDYHCDRVVTECREWWNPSDLESATQVEKLCKPAFHAVDSYNTNKWQHMKLDDHMQASSVAGLVDKLRGASNYLNERPSETEVTAVFRCRIKALKKTLDVSSLLKKNAFLLPDATAKNWEPHVTKATHVIVGLSYGAEAYYVLVDELNAKGYNKDARIESKKNLQKMVEVLQWAAEEDKSADDVKKELKEEVLDKLSRLKCRVYSDFQVQPVREMDCFEAIDHCRHLCFPFFDVEFKAVTLSVILCPLKVIVNSRMSKQFHGKFDYFDIDPDLSARCCFVWSELERIESRADAVRNTFKVLSGRDSFRKFGDIIAKYKDVMQNTLQTYVVKERANIRDQFFFNVERVLDMVESHAIFKPSRLERFLRYKQAESNMASEILGMAGIVFAATEPELTRALIYSSGKKYALVLGIPSLDERTNFMLKEMEVFLSTCGGSLNSVDHEPTMSSEEDDASVEDDHWVPWHMNPRKRAVILDKIQKFGDYIKSNSHLKDQVQFVITCSDLYEKFGCRYTVFEQDKALQLYMKYLPHPPTGLRISLATNCGKIEEESKNTTPILVEWDYESPGFPCHFLVEYRKQGSSDDAWVQQKTSKPDETELIINLPDRASMEIRVAADTCIGRSEFSESIVAESMVRVRIVSSDKKEFEWNGDVAPEKDIVSNNLEKINSTLARLNTQLRQQFGVRPRPTALETPSKAVVSPLNSSRSGSSSIIPRRITPVIEKRPFADCTASAKAAHDQKRNSITPLRNNVRVPTYLHATATISLPQPRTIKTGNTTAVKGVAAIRGRGSLSRIK